MALSPMMQQYLNIKKQHPDKIIFFRLGDFYEMFFDDAILASKELELTLTGRECGMEERAPMCGVPFHASEGYIARLIEKGYKVAICEQLEDPSTTKGIVKRDVVRVVTPGTLIESSMLEDDKNNYIASVYISKNSAGVCFADISTGTAHTSVLFAENIQAAVISELCRFSPREVLINEKVLSCKLIIDYIKSKLGCGVELIEKEGYNTALCEEYLRTHFGDEYEKITGVKYESEQFYTLAVLIDYLNQTQKKGVERLKTVENYSENQFMHLSPVTRANLELTQTLRAREKKGTLLWVLDKTKTAMGKRLIRTYTEQPLLDANLINTRLDGVEELVKDSVLRADLSEALSNVFDIERLMTRAVYGSASPREVYALAFTCEQLPVILKLIEHTKSTAMCEIKAKADPLTDICNKIKSLLSEDAPALLKDGNIIKSGANEEVDELRGIVNGGKDILGAMETKLKEETNIRTLKIGYNRVFGYYIEVSKSFTSMVPEHFVRKQTIANSERYITDELKQLENKILGANERLLTLERNIFDELLKEISSHVLRIQTTASAIANLDVLCSFANVAVQNNYTRPEVHTGTELLIKEGRHPVVECLLQGSLFVPNNTTLDCAENRTAIITGPNMAGKSTYMRQTALIVLMAQIGSFVPASSCRMGVVDAIFTRVGASDDLSSGQSTFMVEMTEVAEILNCATSKSLAILDEIGRGTSTFDGMSIARAVVEHIGNKETGVGCKTLFATHYHELTDLEHTLDGVKNYNIAAKKRGDDITFLRRIVRGPADDSYGIEVAKLAGLPESVTKRAKAVLKILEENSLGSSDVTQLQFECAPAPEDIKTPNWAKKLEDLDVEVLTPIEALNILHELKKQMNEV